MPWPTPQDYSEAMQSPQISFSDPELKTGQVETDQLGLPRPISGRFAIVYKMHCGGRHWAVRCFQTEVPDQQQRYAAISDHLRKSRLPYTVGFEFLKEGIRIKGQWYPILKMEWIAGQPLNFYVEQHLKDPQALIHLAESWLTMTQALRKASLAHGDLQDGNVLVVGNEIKLLDYDGMFVPALAGRTSSESGHRNYQHPGRSASDYGLYLDNFSDWVIYLSLVALAIDPSLWTKLKCGDECLLFRKDDYLPQHMTGALAALSQHADPKLQSVAKFFATLLPLAPAKIPILDVSKVAGLSAPKPSKPVPAPTLVTASPPGNADWLSDYVKPQSGTSSAKPSRTAVLPAAPTPSAKVSVPTGQVPPMPTTGSNWVLDFITPPAPTAYAAFQSSLIVPRLTCFFFLWMIFTIPLLKSAFADVFLDPLMISLLFYAVVRFYRRDPAVRERRVCWKNLQQQQTILAGLEYKIRENDTKQTVLQMTETQEKANLDRQNATLVLQEEREKKRVSADFKTKSASILTRINQLNRPMQKLQSDYQASVTRMNQQIAQVQQDQALQISGALQPSQQQFIQRVMQEARIDAAGIPGIGPKLAAKLADHGYISAAQISQDVSNVEGIGLSKAQALIDWRQSVLKDAQSRLPTQLTNDQIKAISAKHEAKFQALVKQAGLAQLQFEEQTRLLLQQSASAQNPLDDELSAAQTEFQAHTQEITTKYLPAYSHIKQQKTKVTRDYNKQRTTLALETADLQKAINDQNIQVGKAQQELEVYQGVTFGRFIQALLIGQRRP